MKVLLISDKFKASLDAIEGIVIRHQKS